MTDENEWKLCASYNAALNAADVPYSAYSSGGINLFGSQKSIAAAVEAFHIHSQADELRRNLRHWREECGKLHSQLDKAKDAAKADRDSFAAAALPGVIMARKDDWIADGMSQERDFAIKAYKIADAMLAEREKEQS